MLKFFKKTAEKKYKKQLKIIKDSIGEHISYEDDLLQRIYQKSTLSIENTIAIISVVLKRKLEIMPHDSQLLGVLSMLDGNLIEMKTGEGKTIVAIMTAIMYAKKHKKVKIVTVNDYLALRDYDYSRQIFDFFGISIGAVVQGDMLEKKIRTYQSQVIYGTASTFVFDYLSNNLKYEKEEIFEENFDCVIIDEIDQILIDEARTPLIISGKKGFVEDFYKTAYDIGDSLIKEEDYEVDIEFEKIYLLSSGVHKIEQALQIEKLFTHQNINWANQIQQSITAKEFYKKNVQYLIKEGKIEIVDENNGRMSVGRRWSNGLHQAIEVKENVRVMEENINLAELTFQNFFSMFEVFVGMSGTLETEKKELKEIYKKNIEIIPTNKPLQREDKQDLLFATQAKKIEYIVNKINSNNSNRPVLIGTISIEQSEYVSAQLSKEGIKHDLLNAKNDFEEASIIKNAGKFGHVTIATNMAGRGVDIVLEKGTEKVGGLLVIGFERNQNKRIDNQLIGRSGRQGDKGESIFLVSLEDKILNVINDTIKGMLKEVIKDQENSTKMLSRIISKQQERIENNNFKQRKSLYEYDRIIQDNRKLVYEMRMEFLVLKDDEENFEMLKNKVKSYKEFYLNNIDSETQLELKVQNDFGLNEEVNTYEDLLKYLDNKIEEQMTYQRFSLIKKIFIEQIDEEWRNYLRALGQIRKGIHLRSHGQKNPMVEYQILSQRLFKETLNKMKISILKMVIAFDFKHEYDKNNLEEYFDDEELMLVDILEENNKEVQQFIERITKQEIDYEKMVVNYVEEVYEGLFKKYENNEVLLKDLTGSNIDTKLSESEIKKTINERMKEQVNGFSKDVKKEDLYRDIFIANVESNYKEYISGLENVLLENHEIGDKTVVKINELYEYLKMKTKYDIIKTLTNLNKLKVSN